MTIIKNTYQCSAHGKIVHKPFSVCIETIVYIRIEPFKIVNLIRLSPFILGTGVLIFSSAIFDLASSCKICLSLPLHRENDEN